VEQLCLQLDLVGIAFLTVGDFISGIYMVFYCEPLQRNIYWSMVSECPCAPYTCISYLTVTLVGRLEFSVRLPS
jgi:hypothetical protein